MKKTRLLFTTILSIITCGLSAQSGGSVFSTTPNAENTTTVPAEEQANGRLATSKGNFMVGTGIGFSTSTSKVNVSGTTGSFSGDGGSSSQLNLSPNIGYFFADNFTFGVGMDLIASRNNSKADITNPNSPSQETVNSNLLFGPFARLYLGVSQDKALFLTTTVGFGNSRDEFTSVDNKLRTISNSLITIGAGPGFTVFSKGGFALESIVRYNYARSKSDISVNEVSEKNITRTNAFDFSVGLQYYFGGLKSLREQQQQLPQDGDTGRF